MSKPILTIGIGDAKDWREATPEERRRLGIPDSAGPVQIRVAPPSPERPPLDASEERIVVWLERCAAEWRRSAAGYGDDIAAKYEARAGALEKAARHIRELRHRE